MEIQAVRAADVGLYTCAIKSPGGNETRSARLSVIELPFAPTNVKAERLDTAAQRAVNVSWTPGFNGNSPIKQYIVQKRELPELGLFNSILVLKIKKQVFIYFSYQIKKQKIAQRIGSFLIIKLYRELMCCWLGFSRND